MLEQSILNNIQKYKFVDTRNCRIIAPPPPPKLQKTRTKIYRRKFSAVNPLEKISGKSFENNFEIFTSKSFENQSSLLTKFFAYFLLRTS